MTERYLKMNELRAMLGNRARSAIYADVKRGDLPPPIKVGGTNYWRESVVHDRLKSPEQTAE